MSDKDSSPPPTTNVENRASEFGSDVTLVSNPPDRENIKLSWRRWPVLFAFVLFGITNFLTDDLSCILHTMLELLDLPLDKYVYIGLIAGNLPILTTLPTGWFVDQYGIKTTMYVTTFLMIIRNGSKALLFNPDLPYWHEYKVTYWIISTIAGAQVLSAYYCMPLKISENWFSASERSIAWTLMISTAGIGASIAAFTYPRYINSVKDVKPLFYLNLICAAVTAITVFICITRSKPKYPPSERMITSSLSADVSYIKTFKKMLNHKDMVLHLINSSIFEGLAIAVLTVLQDILLTSGHDKIFIGDLMSINSIVSLVATIGLSTLVHRLPNITLVCKLAALTRLVVFVISLITMVYPTPGWAVLTASMISQVGIGWASPNFNNMTAHLASGVVSEATVAGFITLLVIISMNISKAIFVALIVSTYGKSDYTYSMLFTVSICSLSTFIYVILFRGKRLQDSE